MPIFDYQCSNCGTVFDVLLFGTKKDPQMHQCSNCDQYTILSEENRLGITGAPSFKIKGMRAANGYGLKSIDTYGVDQITGKESGYSFTSNKAQTEDHNLGEDK